MKSNKKQKRNKPDAITCPACGYEFTPKKNQKRNKPSEIPPFFPANSPHEKNLLLAEYGKKVGRRENVIALYQRIAEWRTQLPASLKSSLERGADADAIERLAANTSARVAWCQYFEDAIEKNDSEFFETIAALIKHKMAGKPKKHPVEYYASREYVRLVQESARRETDGRLTAAPPTKGQLKAAVEKALGKGNQGGIKWPSRLWTRLHLDWLPEEKSGRPRKAGK